MNGNSSRRSRRGALLLGASVVLVFGLAATYVFSIEPDVLQSDRQAAVTTTAPATVTPVTDAAISPVNSEARQLLDAFAVAFENAATTVDRSVVPILSEQRVPAQQALLGPFHGQEGSFPDDLLRRFFFDIPRGQQSDERLQSLGSGVIVSADGYILTNNHVVQDADRLTVMTADHKQHEAKIVGTDPETDLAVIKIDAPDLTPATLGDSSKLRVGQWVIAVGNPLRMLHSVTAGIISATGRSSVGIADYEDFIQTDASINPGNSGGALADLDGRVIGINTAIASPSGGNVGVGFAIPINMARQVMDQLIDHGSISRGYLGVAIQDLNDSLAQALDIAQSKGALVGDVTSGGPADEAGIRRGDVIVRFDGHDVDDAATLRNRVAAVQPGTRVRVDAVRDGRDTSFTVRLGERPSTGEQIGERRGSSEPTQQRLGLSAQDLTPQLADQLGYRGAQGALVTGTDSGSPAERAGLQRGDLIVEANRAPVTSVNDLRRIVGETKPGAPVLLVVRRGPNTFYVAIDLDEG